MNDVSVKELLDDFVEPEDKESTHSVTYMDDEEYVAMMLKKDAKRILKNGRKDEPVSPTESLQERGQVPSRPVVSEKISALKRCQNCYYCIDSHMLGGSVWCKCSHSGRSGESDLDNFWIKSKLNLPCWRSASS